MKKLAVLIGVAAALAASTYGGATATLVKTRSSAKAAVVPGKWHAGFAACKKYALENKVPLIAVWSNGDACGHCVMFENGLNSSAFKSWMASSGCVFYFIYAGDGGDGKAGSTVFHWIRNNKNTSYPFVRIYWPAGKVDIATVGDIVDGKTDGAAGGKKSVAYFKSKLAKFNPVKIDPELPYSIEFDPNYVPGEENENDVTNGMESVQATYGTAVTLPTNIFTRTDYAFSGWAKTAAGTVAYKDLASVKGLASKSNAVVKLYARWTRTTYGTYYTGVKYTIKPTTYAGAAYAGYTASPATLAGGLKWSTKGYYTGTPKTAGTYTVTLKKGTTSIKRTVVVVKDEVKIDGLEGTARDGKIVIDTDTSEVFDNAITAVSGGLTNIKVSGLPEGLSYDLSSGAITGRAKKAGTYTITVSGVNVKNQTVKATYTFVVKEGNAILLNGLAHADELWAFTDDDLSYAVHVKVKHGEDSYELVTPETAEVEVLDADGKALDGGFLFADGQLTGQFAETGVYTVTVKTTVDKEELSLTFTVNVLEGVQPPPQ